MGTVVACFLFAMGNRPQGSKWKYLTAMVIFALTTAYMLGAASFCVVRAVQGSSGSLIYAQIVISLLATCESRPFPIPADD
jgi:chitin synthase